MFLEQKRAKRETGKGYGERDYPVMRVMVPVTTGAKQWLMDAMPFMMT